MKLINITLLSLVTVGMGLPLRAENENQASSLSLNRVLELALRQNPEIQAAAEKIVAARSRVVQEMTPEKPRIDLERMYAPRGQNIFSDAEEKNVAISQEIMSPAALYYRGRVARKGTQKAEAEYRAKVEEVLEQVKVAYATLFLNRHHIEVSQEIIDLMRQFARAAESKYAIGQASQADVLKAQVELSRMLTMLEIEKQELETSRAMLNTLLNRAPDAELGTPEEPKVEPFRREVKDLEPLVLANAPDLKAAQRELEKRGASVAAARSDYVPDLMLQYRRRQMVNEPDSQDAMLGFSLPVWFWKQNAMVKEAKADRRMAEADYASMKNIMLFNAKDFYVKVKTTQQLIELYRTTVLPQAEQALKVAMGGYQSQKVSFLELLDAARSLLQFRLEYYQYLADHERYFAGLERVVGMSLRGVKQ